jgi:hypothetical protein
VTNRQRVLLYFLSLEPQGVKKITLMKWLFLFSQAVLMDREKLSLVVLCSKPTPFSIKIRSHYDFVPYKYGPYSFEVTRDIQRSLSHFVYVDKDTILLQTECKEALNQELSRLHPQLREVARRIWERFHQWNQEQLLDFVYKTFAWYAIRGERRRSWSGLKPSPSALPTAPCAIYTIGYEGRTLETFLNTLLSKGICGILDVRYHAYSHKFGFSGKQLERYASCLQLSYNHIPELGVDPKLRKQLREKQDYDWFFCVYERGLQEKQVFVQRALNLLHQQPMTLLCFEADPNFCHRSRLAAYLAAECCMPVHHL